MKKIKLRDFQRNFCRLQKVTCQVYKEGGVVIGTWLPGREPLLESKYFPPVAPLKMIGDLSTPAQEQEKVRTGKSIDLPAKPDQSYTRKCTMCKKAPAVYTGKHFEDGEEHDIDLCKVCFWKYPGKRNLKKIL